MVNQVEPMSRRTNPLVMAVTLLMTVPATCAADAFLVHAPITGGTVIATQRLSLRTIYALSGDNFRVDVGSDSGSSNILGRIELFPGTTYDLGAGASSPFGGTITYLGTAYSLSGSVFGPSTGSMSFSTDPFVLLPAMGQQVIDVSVPFSAFGQIGFVNSPTDRLVLELSGGGVATARATRVRFPTDHLSYEIREIDYTFGVSPTPEPTTMLLLVSGLAMTAVRSRRSRHIPRFPTTCL